MSDSLKELNKFLENIVSVELDPDRAQKIFDEDKGQQMLNLAVECLQNDMEWCLDNDEPITGNLKANMMNKLLMVLETKGFIKINID